MHSARSPALFALSTRSVLCHPSPCRKIKLPSFTSTTFKKVKHYPHTLAQKSIPARSLPHPKQVQTTGSPLGYGLINPRTPDKRWQGLTAANPREPGPNSVPNLFYAFLPFAAAVATVLDGTPMKSLAAHPLSSARAPPLPRSPRTIVNQTHCSTNHPPVCTCTRVCCLLAWCAICNFVTVN